jgi:hypothetical protein
MTNLRLIAGLAPIDRCLFHMGVHPAGGTGYRDSSLPYDDLDPLTAAVEIVRAQVMRHNLDLVAGVVRPLHSTSGHLEVVVDSRRGRTPTLDDLVRDDAAALAAVAVLRERSIPITVTPRPAPTIRRMCEIGDALTAIRDAQGEVVTLMYRPDPSSGVVRVQTTAAGIPLVRAAMADFGPDVLVEDEPQDIHLF